MSDFQLKMANFEGPLDLLLSLIEKKKMHISEIALAQVTDDYIAFIRQHEQISVEDMANFILIASTLMLIKSSSLISTLAVTEEEKDSMADLERRLRLYQLFKEAAGKLKILFGQHIIFSRENTRNFEPIFTPTTEITTTNLRAAMNNIVSSWPKKEPLPQLTMKKVMSLEEAITNLTTRIEKAFKMRFSDFVKEGKKEKVNIIVSFLGMLELVKEGIIDVKQDLLFAEIEMESQKVSTPHY